MQACQHASPIQSGVYILLYPGLILIFGLLTGVSITMTGLYLPQIWVGWVLSLISSGVYESIRGKTGLGLPVGILAIMGAGSGIFQAGLVFPVLAPIPVELSTQALSFFMFVRFLSQVRSHPPSLTPLLTLRITDLGHHYRRNYHPKSAQKQLAQGYHPQPPAGHLDCLFARPDYPNAFQ